MMAATSGRGAIDEELCVCATTIDDRRTNHLISFIMTAFREQRSWSSRTDLLIFGFRERVTRIFGREQGTSPQGQGRICFAHFHIVLQ